MQTSGTKTRSVPKGNFASFKWLKCSVEPFGLIPYKQLSGLVWILKCHWRILGLLWPFLIHWKRNLPWLVFLVLSKRGTWWGCIWRLFTWLQHCWTDCDTMAARVKQSGFVKAPQILFFDEGRDTCAKARQRKFIWVARCTSSGSCAGTIMFFPL